jgi:hypothetical protein
MPGAPMRSRRLNQIMDNARWRELADKSGRPARANLADWQSLREARVCSQPT